MAWPTVTAVNSSPSPVVVRFSVMLTAASPVWLTAYVAPFHPNNGTDPVLVRQDLSRRMRRAPHASAERSYEPQVYG